MAVDTKGKKTIDYLRFFWSLWFINFITLHILCYNSTALSIYSEINQTLENQMTLVDSTSTTQNQVQANWHALTPEQTLKQLATPQESGLTSDEAARRLQSY